MPNSKITALCLYHGVDMDGCCSAELVNLYCELSGFGDCHYVPANYEPDFDIRDNLKSLPNVAHIFIVDYHIPVGDMWSLLDNGYRVYWADHHQSAITEYQPHLEAMQATGLFQYTCRTDVSAAALVLEQVFRLSPEKLTELKSRYPNIMDVVRLVSTYDTWNKTDQVLWGQALCLHYGIFGMDEVPYGPINKMFQDVDLFDEVISDGLIIRRYRDDRSASLCREYAGTLHWHDKKFLIINGYGNSALFDKANYPQDCDASLVWVFSPRIGRYKVSMYALPTSPKDLNLWEIAKEYGGGGHPGAAGFSVSELPFRLQDIKHLS